MAERLATNAFEAGARLVALPEFFTSAIVPARDVYRAALDVRNPAVEMLRRLASRYQGYVGGSMLIVDKDQLYNRYFFAGPNELHTHDKDLPTKWENNFYVGGSDDGVFQTGLGGVGAAVCWECIRTQTVRRMLGKVKLIMTGTHC